MNANLQPQTPAINNWLANASSRLSKAGIASSHLDAELILAHSIGKSRTYLHAHPEQIISTDSIYIANLCLAKRLKRIPIAYITGHKEFYGRDFIVSPSTLVPRPESEDIINILKKLLPSTTYHLLPTKLLDVGTGCGCLGITINLEFPKLDVSITDISTDALSVAKLNAQKLSANVTIIQGDLLQELSEKTDIIVANLPYVDRAWDQSPETYFEPTLALHADDHGTSIIKQLIIQASNSLTENGFLIIEADPTQHKLLIEYASKKSFAFVQKLGFIIVFMRQF